MLFMEHKGWQQDCAVHHSRSGTYSTQIASFLGQECLTNMIKTQQTSKKGFFLRNIVPLTTSIGFIYITNEESIGQQILHAKRLHGDLTRITNTVGLKTVLLSSDDKRLVMLAQNSHGFHIYGSWLGKPHIYKELKIDPREILYDPGRDNAYLKESGGKTELYLTILKTRMTHRPGLDTLFVPDTNHDAE